MKQLLPLLVLFAACSEKPNSESSFMKEEHDNILENLTYSIDMVVVDSGNELLYLKDLSVFGKSNYFSVSQKSDFLYFFDRHSFLLNEINLESLELQSIYPFEKEGPDGIGRFVYSFQNLSNGTFYGRDIFGKAWYFTKQGKKIAEVEFNKEELLQKFSFELNLANHLLVDLRNDKLYSLPNFHNFKSLLLAIMEAGGQHGRLEALPKFEKSFDYSIQFDEDGGESRVEQFFLQQPNDLVLVSCTVGNAIYIYDPELDSLRYQEFPHELTPLEKNEEVKNEVFSRMEFQTEADKLHTQINYYDFYWDEITQRYYRFASKGLPLANVDSPKQYEYFMFAYDKELTLKGETKLEALRELPLGGFFKDGKLWSYVNVEDELGFAVFTFDFKKL